MTGLIGLAIIGIWLVVLIPMWLNRHEGVDANRSMDSFSTAMTVLSKRTTDQGVTVDDYLSADQADSPPRRRPPAVRMVAGRARLMARRRRVVAALAGLLLLLALTALLGVTSWWYTLAVALAAAGYAVHLRNEAIRDRELRRRRASRAGRPSAAEWQVHEPLRAPAEAAQGFVSEESVLPAPAASAAGTANGSRWEPVPVPLPTYVSKPVATRAPAPAPRANVDATGTIDLTRPGAWSEEHGAYDEQIDHRYLLESADDELDLILERRRAVGD